MINTYKMEITKDKVFTMNKESFIKKFTDPEKILATIESEEFTLQEFLVAVYDQLGIHSTCGLVAKSLIYAQQTTKAEHQCISNRGGIWGYKNNILDIMPAEFTTPEEYRNEIYKNIVSFRDIIVYFDDQRRFLNKENEEEK